MTPEELLSCERRVRLAAYRQAQRLAKLTGLRLKKRWGGFQLLNRVTGEILHGSFYELSLDQTIQICKTRAVSMRIAWSYQNG